MASRLTTTHYLPCILIETSHAHLSGCLYRSVNYGPCLTEIRGTRYADVLVSCQLGIEIEPTLRLLRVASVYVAQEALALGWLHHLAASATGVAYVLLLGI